MKKIEGYEGICAICFWPIKMGDGIKLREKGRKFHRSCAEENPESYYCKLERRLARRAGT